MPTPLFRTEILNNKPGVLVSEMGEALVLIALGSWCDVQNLSSEHLLFVLSVKYHSVDSMSAFVRNTFDNENKCNSGAGHTKLCKEVMINLLLRHCFLFYHYQYGDDAKL